MSYWVLQQNNLRTKSRVEGEQELERALGGCVALAAKGLGLLKLSRNVSATGFIQVGDQSQKDAAVSVTCRTVPAPKLWNLRAVQAVLGAFDWKRKNMREHKKRNPAVRDKPYGIFKKCEKRHKNHPNAGLKLAKA